MVGWGGKRSSAPSDVTVGASEADAYRRRGSTVSFIGPPHQSDELRHARLDKNGNRRWRRSATANSYRWLARYHLWRGRPVGGGSRRRVAAFPTIDDTASFWPTGTADLSSETVRYPDTDIKKRAPVAATPGHSTGDARAHRDRHILSFLSTLLCVFTRFSSLLRSITQMTTIVEIDMTRYETIVCH